MKFESIPLLLSLFCGHTKYKLPYATGSPCHHRSIIITRYLILFLLSHGFHPTILFVLRLRMRCFEFQGFYIHI